MDLRAIAYFAAVAEAGTVRGAAARLGISQPALTKAIRRLEDEVGVVLFDRQARGVTLTAYGRTLLRHARNLQASHKEAREEIAALRAGIAGRVRMGAGPSWERIVLPRGHRLLHAPPARGADPCAGRRRRRAQGAAARRRSRLRAGCDPGRAAARAGSRLAPPDGGRLPGDRRDAPSPARAQAHGVAGPSGRIPGSCRVRRRRWRSACGSSSARMGCRRRSR